MIDIDDILRPWTGAVPTDWDGDAAIRLARRIADASALRANWEAGDEEWIRLVRGATVEAVLSVRFPLAAAVADVAGAIRDEDPRVSVVEVTDVRAAELRGSPDVLRATVLPYQWSETFDPERFSALDLFHESV